MSAGDAAIPDCPSCTDEKGALQPRDERLERMTQWSMRQDGLDDSAARRKAAQHA